MDAEVRGKRKMVFNNALLRLVMSAQKLGAATTMEAITKSKAELDEAADDLADVFDDANVQGERYR